MVRIGDYVRVIKEETLNDETKFVLRYGSYYPINDDRLCFCDGMLEYCGKIAQVCGIDSRGYFTLRFGGNRANWTWSEHFIEQTLKPKFNTKYPDIDFYVFLLGSKLRTKIDKLCITELEAYKRCYSIATKFIDSVDYIAKDFNAETSFIEWVNTHEKTIKLILKGEDE